ncbi:MAG TPA: DUF1549 and DUF1553 domain-containing protein, partial [Chthonomonadaceae bacterium]|nr:DUF1549 and DUF1553 domain-containing protein [Chthonomonadaceae bacterium]
TAPIVRVGRDGFVEPIRAGKTVLTVTAGGQRTVVPVEVKSVAQPPISFVRDVMPILSKAGCNAGTCHGSAKGKNGFKLSLRGYDPDFDHHALIDDISGRRFNRSDPAQSLMLLKPTGAVPHRGGVVITPDSRYYAVLKQWIAEGAKSDTATVKRVSSLEVLPAVPNVTLPKMTQRTVVIAHYPDGGTRDVSREAVMTSSLPEVATVSPSGEITAVRRGEAALLVRYEGTYATNNITVLGNRDHYQWAAAPEYGYIDKLIDAKLRKLKALPSSVCDDATFLRRATIDLTGIPPTPDTTRAFLADMSPSREKRAKLVDALLASPEFVDRWTNKWADLLDCNSKFLGPQGVRKFRNWLHSAVAENMPYDKFVYSLVTASGDTNEDPPANYLRVIRDSSTATENVTQLFLGVRFSCAKCHDHPFERWTQNQYYQFGAFFAKVGYKPASNGAEVVYNKDDGEVMHPKTGLAVAPYVPVGSNPKIAVESARRDAFGRWLTDSSNPFFSRAMANRLWSYFFGKGIIDPVDDIRASNPPVNPELLEALNHDFVTSGYDLKHMMRVIVLSRAYQSSIASNAWNVDDKTNFSHALPRRLEAEQLLDAINLVTGTQSTFGGLPAGTRAEQIPDAAAAGADGFLDLFGRPARDTPCECERSSSVSLGQAMALINGPTTDTISNKQGRIARLMATNPSDDKIVEELFLAALCRMPSERERKESLETLRTAATKTEGAQDLMWALLNSPAFLFNR